MNKILSIIMPLALFSACTATQEQEPEAMAAQETHSNLHFTKEQLELAEVEMGRPEKRLIREYIACTGMVEVPPQSLHSIYTPVEGFVETAPFILGSYVKKGAVLTRLSHPSLLRLQREFLETAGRLPYLEQEYERQKMLSSNEAASVESFQKAEAEWKALKAHYKGVRAELQMIGIKVEALETKEELQNSINIYAPASGFLTEVNINPGKLVTPGDQLFQLVDNQHMHLELQVFAKDAPKVQKGAAVTFNVSGSDDTFKGEVFLLGQMIDPETKTTRVHSHFENEPTHLLPGTYVQAEIAIPSDSVWTVPEEALIREGERAFLFLSQKDHFVRKEVQPGRSDGNYTELLNFRLAKDELIALRGAYYLNAGGEEGPEHSH
jgi:cobalt-zinc-cadmium efflux system membrane fusion protein